MKAKLHYVLSIAMFLLVFSTYGQNLPWKKTESIKYTKHLDRFNLKVNDVITYELDINNLNQNLLSATSRTSTKKDNAPIVSIPNIDGKYESFKIYEASVFSKSLAEKYPEIKSYVGVSLDNPGTRLRMSVSSQGIQTMVSGIDKPYVFMQPLEKGSDSYVLYSRKSKVKKANAFKCDNHDHYYNDTHKSSASKIDEGGANTKALQTFRIAISTTSEYTNYHGGSVSDALAAINATLSRVNEIFETDMAITFELVDATELIYTNVDTDPYSDAGIGVNGAWSGELQTTLTNTIGENAYDLGHLFGASGGGGNANCIGCVCVDSQKGSAYTSPGDGRPEGDTFDLDFVIHEIGHQMGGYHTWSFESEGTNMQVEPGSGSTIMGYAGITGVDDVQTNSDPYFHYQSIKQILDNLETKNCQTVTTISNNPPVADAGNDYTIPQGTPYLLEGSATDADGNDNLTYCWEQIDSGIVNSGNFSSTLTSGSTNRSLPPTSLSYRYIPNLNNVLNGQLTESNPVIGSAWESVSTVTRNLNWALTVRDRTISSVMGNGQSSYDTMAINVDANAGPFIVTSQNTTGISWTPGSAETITWDVANTNSGGVNTSHVNILLSTDRGLTFSTVLSSNTPNDGSENIIVPFISEPFCRIKIEPVNNIYYAINEENFAINYTIEEVCPAPYDSANNLNLDFDDNNGTTHTINVPDGGIINDVKVAVNVSHTYINDVVIKLTHPDGTTSTNIWNRNCSDEDDIVINFEDLAGNINCNSTSAGNTYSPSGSLSVFNGLDAAGNWEISLEDEVDEDDGILNSWSLEICTLSLSIIDPEFQTEVDGIRVYPNPITGGNFTIAFNSNSNKNINIVISDMRGRVILNEEYSSTPLFRNQFSIAGIKSGIYIIQIGDGDFLTKKRIIVK